MTNDWTFEWLETWDDVDRHLPPQQWLDWFSSSTTPHVFAHPTLIQAWCKSYRQTTTLLPRYVIARQHDAIVLMPLVLHIETWKRARLRLLAPVGFSEFDYHDPLLIGTSDIDVLTRFWNALLPELERRRESIDHRLINGIHHPTCPPQWQKSETCPYIDLQDIRSVDDYLQTLKKRVRGDIRRQLRRIESIGGLRYQIYTKPTEFDEANAVLKALLDAHHQRWPQSYKVPGLHSALLRAGLEAGIAHLSVLTIANDAAAWHFGFRFAKRFHWYMPAFNEAFSDYSPSKIHLYCCIQDAIANEIPTFDLLKGNEPYKTAWTTMATPIYTYQHHNTGTVSTLKRIWTDTTVPWLRDVRQRLAPRHDTPE